LHTKCVVSKPAQTALFRDVFQQTMNALVCHGFNVTNILVNQRTALMKTV